MGKSVIAPLIKGKSREEISAFMEEKGIKVSFDGALAIFNYDILANFYDPIVQEARGIIINYETGEVVCFPFRKFGNFQEGYADEIDWESARIQEKVDGSIVKLWWNKEKCDWQWSTNGVINAFDAPVRMTGFPKSFMHLIEECCNYRKITSCDWPKNSTHIFELTGPENRVVVDYKIPNLYYLGSRDNLSGEEYSCDFDILRPKEYDVPKSLDDVCRLAKTLNKGSNVCKNEGFVVVDKNFHRIKVKTEEYVALHHLTSHISSKKNILHLLRENPEILSDYLEMNPLMRHIVKWYEYELEELYFRADEIAKFSRAVYEEFGYDRKVLAAILKDEPLRAFGFSALGNNLSGKELCSSARIDKYISDYKARPLPDITNYRNREEEEQIER